MTTFIVPTHAIVIMGDKTVSNYLHGVTQVPVDFPPAPKLND